jgi:O-antigen/teichoic acid export membrane protein
MWARLLKANAAYALGSAANSAALLLLVPFLVNRLSVAEYGAWSLFEVAIVVLTTLILAGSDVGLMREYWFLDDDAQRQRLTGTVILGVLAWGTLLLGLFAALSGGAWALVPHRHSLSQLLLGSALALATAFCEALFNLLLSVFRIREQARTFALLASARMFGCVLFVAGAVQLGHSVNGALAGRLVAALLGVAAATAAARDAIRFSFDWSRLRRVLHYGLPILPASLAGYVLFASDRYILQRFATLEVVACYAFAYKIAAVLDTLITRPFGLDWSPRRFRIATEPNAEASYNAALLSYLSVCAAVMLGVLALTPSVYAWLAPPAYSAGQGIVPVLLLAYLVWGLSVPLNVGIMLKDKTRYLPRIGWCAAVICMGLNLLLIPRFGMWGAAWATLIAYAVSTTGIAWFSLKLYPIAYAWGPLAFVVLLLALGAAGLVGIDLLLEPQPWFARLLVRLLWVAALCGILGRRLLREQRAELQARSARA